MVHIESSNQYSTIAVPGDIVTLTFEGNESLSSVLVTISNDTCNVVLCYNFPLCWQHFCSTLSWHNTECIHVPGSFATDRVLIEAHFLLLPVPLSPGGVAHNREPRVPDWVSIQTTELKGTGLFRACCVHYNYACGHGNCL